MLCPYLDSNVKWRFKLWWRFWVNVSTDSKENYGSVARTKDNPFNTEVFTIASVMNIKPIKMLKILTLIKSTIVIIL